MLPSMRLTPVLSCCCSVFVSVFVGSVLQQDAGMVGYRFNTIGVSDGISMGTDGMSFSLQSRDLIADSIETVMSAQVRVLQGQNRVKTAVAAAATAAGGQSSGRSCSCVKQCILTSSAVRQRMHAAAAGPSLTALPPSHALHTSHHSLAVVLQWYDANVSLPGCDKNMPGSIIAMARLNRPSIMVYGGTIKPGHSVMDGSVLDIVSAFQSYGERDRGTAWKTLGVNT